MKPVNCLMLSMALFCLLAYPHAGTSAENFDVTYWPSSQCSNCHSHIFAQHAESMHAAAFTNPVFQGQYFRELLPQVSADPALAGEAEGCIACHAPIAHLTKKGSIVSERQVDPERSGVTCDFCHTVTGYEGERPENGNYISDPGTQKYGPFMHVYNWHHMYSEFQTKSEFCAVCHNAVNRHGLEIKSTYSEWKNSGYAKKGVHCQDCHMNVMGFLISGRPVYESGRAARTNLVPTPYREKIYTHRFPGAHSRTQVVGSLTLRIETASSAASAGDEITIDILVDNSRTGHKMPSGSADLRLLWLELKAHIGEETIRTVPVAASSDIEGQGAYDVAGKGAFDGEFLRDDVPKGNRIYRAIFVDKAAKQTLSSYNAVKIIFDNRLDAEEIRKETYRFRIPEDAKGKVYLFASLNYLPYPGAFADRFGLPAPDAVEIAFAKKEIPLR